MPDPRTDPEFPIIILLRSSIEAAEKLSRVLPSVRPKTGAPVYHVKS